MRKIISFISAALVFGLTSNMVFACGPFTVEPYFSPTKHADYPLREYVRGSAGIVPPTYGQMSLFVFYRQLNDLPLTVREQNQVVAALRSRIGVDRPVEDNSQNAKDTAAAEAPNYFLQWTNARAKVFNSDPKILVDKQSADHYSSYENCLDDAFDAATKTLEARISQYGIGDNVKEWLRGQDAVFSNCGSKGMIPDPVSGNAPDWLKQDRQYQIAAALFYDSKYPEARAIFEQIAKDKNSVWSKTADFVVARTYIRQASEIDVEKPDYVPAPTSPSLSAAANADAASNGKLPNSNSMTGNTGGNLQNDADYSNSPKKEIKNIDEKVKEKHLLLDNAETNLKNILSDASMREFYPSATRLLGLVKYRNYPDVRQSELAEILTRQPENPNIENDLIDYIWLLDKTDENADQKDAPADRAKIENQSGQNDLTDWLETYRATDGFAHAFEQWKATGKTHWLVAALIKTEKNNPQNAELTNAADKIARGAAGFATIRYQQIRILLENGQRAAARQKLDQVFAGNLREFPVSAQNKFYSQRMILAANLDEFLKYAQRRASLFVWSDDGNEAGDALTDDKNLSKWKDRTMFDQDSVAFFNEQMPLSVLRQAALSPQLPDYLKNFLITAIWTRAVILNNRAIEKEFAPRLPHSYRLASSSDNREAAALITILRNPVIEPYVPVGFGRADEAPTTIDSNRGNWWCVEDATRKNGQDEDSTHYDLYNFQYPPVYPDFLTAAQKAEGAREHRQILASGDSATFLTQRAIDFANRHPKNPQTPEILHLAVRATRYGCTDEKTSRLSKQAFDILHQNYSRSEWTKKTPYWF